MEEAWNRQRQFVADASHELKTPLTVILANTKIIADSHEITGQKNLTRLDNIGAEAARMKFLIESIDVYKRQVTFSVSMPGLVSTLMLIWPISSAVISSLSVLSLIHISPESTNYKQIRSTNIDILSTNGYYCSWAWPLARITLNRWL